MPRKKKSRKVGQIGTPSVPKEARKPKEPSGRVRKRKGNTAGSRHSASQQATIAQRKQQLDPRVGSKKPIQLVVEEKPKTSAPKKRYHSPAQELEAIENDLRLSRLLDKLDKNAKLTVDDQRYVDEKTARHKTLCKMLGIQQEEEVIDKGSEDIDLFDKFDAIDIDEFKDE